MLVRREVQLVDLKKAEVSHLKTDKWRATRVRKNLRLNRGYMTFKELLKG